MERAARTLVQCTLSIVVFISSSPSVAQPKLRLERTDDADGHRKFRLLEYYHFNTSDTAYFMQVAGYDDSILHLQYKVRDGDTTVYYGTTWFDRGTAHSIPRYRLERLDVPLMEVVDIGMPGRTGRTTIMEPFALIGFAGLLGSAIALPFAIFGENGDNMGAWVIGTGAALGVSLTASVVGKAIDEGEARKRWRLVLRR